MTVVQNVFRRVWGRPNERLIVDYGEDTRLFPTRWRKAWLAVMVLGWIFLPAFLESLPGLSWLSDHGVSAVTLGYAGIFAIVAIGLNLLTGYAGQISLGHSIFLGAGAYFTTYAGTQWGWSPYLWMPGAMLICVVLGLAIGPFALRLRGNYLVVITLGLVFVGEHIFRNWRSVTGGNNGSPAAGVSLDFGFVDLNDLTIGPWSFEREAAMLWFIWAVVGLVAWLAKNITRTRPGRALQAVRDRDLEAEVIGVDLFRYKTMAFAISAGMAGLAGAIFAPYQRFVSPEDFTLLVSIQFIAMIILGGLGTIYGSIVGAVILTTMPRIIESISSDFGIPGVSQKATEVGLVSVASLNVIIYGLLIAIILLIDHRGLAGLWGRIRTYCETWPFSQ